MSKNPGTHSKKDKPKPKPPSVRQVLTTFFSWINSTNREKLYEAFDEYLKQNHLTVVRDK